MIKFDEHIPSVNYDKKAKHKEGHYFHVQHSISGSTWGITEHIRMAMLLVIVVIDYLMREC